MKNLKICYKVIFYITISQMFFSCKKSVDTGPAVQNVPSKKTECYDVFDALDNHPIAGASVTMEHMMTSGYYMPYDGTTDSSGHICNEYDGYLPGAAEILVSKAGYLPKCPGTGAPSEVWLTPCAFIKLHLKNIAPANAANLFFITYPAGDCSGSLTSEFDGALVDTTFVWPVRTGTRIVSWQIYNGPSKDSLMTFISRDTTFYEVLY
jgi:hypothetical protein